MDEIIEGLYLGRVHLFWIRKISPASSTWTKANSYRDAFYNVVYTNGCGKFLFIKHLPNIPKFSSYLTT
jgi:hypothetical protein